MTAGVWHRIAVRVCLGLLLATPAMVFANDDLDVTMRMVRDDDELTESVVREIKLREPVAFERRQSRTSKSANTPREARGADAAREAARVAAEQAREVRGRNEQRGRPELPERPDVSGRPERPDVSKRPERPESP